MLKLCDMNDASQSVWLVAPKVTIGRAAGCDLTIADDSVDKVHAEILVDDSRLILRKVSPTGNIAINGKPVIKAKEIRLGDEVQLGKRVLSVVDPQSIKKDLKGIVAPKPWALRANHRAIAGKVFPIRDQSVIGRASDCDLVFSTSHLSRRHARFEFKGGLLFVVDLGSSNGTYVNGRRVTEARLRRGDEVRFDTLSFSMVGPADDLDKTTVRPLGAEMAELKVQTVKGAKNAARVAEKGAPSPQPVKPASVEAARQTAAAAGTNGAASAQEPAPRSSAFLLITALLVVGGAAAYYYARTKGLLP